MPRKDKRAVPVVSPALTLRQRAEVSLRELPEDFEVLSPAALRQMFHDLRVHQAELEMQNEDLRAAQLALDTAQARYFDFYDLAPVGYLTVNARGLIEQANLTTAFLLGVVRDALLKQSISHFILKEDQEIYYRYRQQLIETWQHQPCDLRLLKADGTSFWARLEAIAVPDEAGVPALRIVLRDITMRKQAELELRQSEQRFRDIARVSADWIWEADAQARYTYVSDGVKALLGYAPEEVLGKVPFDFMPADEAPRVECAFGNIAAAKKSFIDLENIVLSKDGTARITLTSGTPILDPQGNLLGYRGIDRDITARKLAEDQLRGMAAELENRVRERTTQLRKVATQLTLTEERERHLLAQELHDSLGQLLAVIKIKLSALVADSPQASVDEIVKLVDQSDQAVRMITQQLSPPILQMLDFVSALEWLSEEMRRGYGLTVQIHDKNCTKSLVAEIQAMLFRSARELLINVARHAKVGAATLAVRCDDEQLRLVVSDAGCGFTANRFDGGLPGRGSFGLSSIYERMSAIGGQMEIDSRPGHGTTITLTMPCAIAVKEARPS